MNLHFERAVTRLFSMEGGFTDHPNDSGGATNMGITLRTLARWRGTDVTVEDVKNLTRREASDIYFNWYWKPLKCDLMFQYQIAAAIMDVSILFGQEMSAIHAQRALQACGHGEIKDDGDIGIKTLTVLNTVSPALFVEKLHALLRTRIDELVDKYPKNRAFKDGWMNRINKLLLLAVNS